MEISIAANRLGPADADIRLIETLRVEPGAKLPLLAWHERRLRASCVALGYREPAKDLADELGRRARALDTAHYYRLRLLVSRDGSYTIESHPLPSTLEPVKLYLHPDPLVADKSWLAHKTTHRPWYEAAQTWLAANPAYFDILYVNSNNLACEGSRCNLYIQDEQGQWLTPGHESGLLPGVQRQALIDQGLVREARLSRRDLQQATALRVSNALRGWLDAMPLSATDRPAIES